MSEIAGLAHPRLRKPAKVCGGVLALCAAITLSTDHRREGFMSKRTFATATSPIG